MMKSSHRSTLQQPGILIIGTGFGGLGMAIRLKQQGIEDFLILEKSADVGGCWRENTYPGAACDVPSHLYSFSFEPKPDWSRKFAPQAEIHGYLRHCADKYGIGPHIRFQTEVRRAQFDETLGLWLVETVAGEQYRAPILIAACGQLSRPAWPRLRGLETFAGKQFHSAQWDHDYNLTDKRVAVIGTGASAVQFVPEIAGQVASLTLFQRSAPYVIPKPDRDYPLWEQTLLARQPGLQRLNRMRLYWQHEARAFAFYRHTWLMKLFERTWARYLKQTVQDPQLRQKLTPDYPMGCKRILISNNYYQALNRPNVDVVTEAIQEVQPDAVVTRDGTRYPVDALIFGTGFQSNDFLAPMDVVGRQGQSLQARWREGAEAEAYLGISVAGFPNFYMLYGPNTNLGHNSIVFMLERQIGYILQAVQTLRARPGQFLDLKPERQQTFNAEIQKALGETIWEQGCTSWYKTESGKNTNNWPGFTLAYHQLTCRFNPGDYQGVDVGSVSLPAEGSERPCPYP